MPVCHKLNITKATKYKCIEVNIRAMNSEMFSSGIWMIKNGKWQLRKAIYLMIFLFFYHC